MEHYYISSNKYNLQERMTKRGKVYDVVFRLVTIDGQEKQKRLSGFSTKGLAKQGYLEFVTKYCELVKNNPLKKKNPQKEEPTVGELVRAYFATLGNINKESVIYDKQNIFRNYILPDFESVKVKDITEESLYIWQDKIWAMKNERNGEYFSQKYLTKIRGQFSTFLTWVEKRYKYKNLLLDIDKPKRRTPKKEMLFWTREEFEQFISVVDNPMYHALFTFMFFTGRRKGELFALFHKDVKEASISFTKSVNRRTFGKGTWEITSTKEDKECVIPVCQVVQEEIKRYKPPKGKFYFGGEQPLAATTVTRVFDKYIEQAGVKRIRIHDLRHSFVSMLIHLGANFMVVADLISDTVEQVIKTYGHLYQEDITNILLKIK
ncbi:MAG: site-specific integrase [Clostridia bacterium]|nr:site-specific integrase [Clostridia bacterium]